MKFLIIFLMVACSTVKTEKPHEQIETFTYKSSLTWIQKTTECANKLMNHKPFLELVKSKQSFDMSDDNGLQVYDKMIHHKCVIRSYKPFNPFSKAIATTYTQNDIDIYLNRRKTRTIPQWSGTAIHECSHNYGYSHGDNSRFGKSNTVPYWLGYRATEFAEKICE